MTIIPCYFLYCRCAKIQKFKNTKWQTYKNTKTRGNATIREGTKYKNDIDRVVHSFLLRGGLVVESWRADTETAAKCNQMHLMMVMVLVWSSWSAWKMASLTKSSTGGSGADYDNEQQQHEPQSIGESNNPKLLLYCNTTHKYWGREANPTSYCCIR